MWGAVASGTGKLRTLRQNCVGTRRAAAQPGSIHLHGGPPPEVSVWLRPLLTCVGWLILALAATGFFAGWGLLQREEWARTVALVVGFVALLRIPLGTALGIYTLWVLLPTQSDDDYKALAQAA